MGRERGHAVFARVLAERFSCPIVLQRDRARELHHPSCRFVAPVEEVEVFALAVRRAPDRQGLIREARCALRRRQQLGWKSSRSTRATRTGELPRLATLVVQVAPFQLRFAGTIAGSAYAPPVSTTAEGAD